MSKRFTSARAILVIAAATFVACGGDRALVVSPRLGSDAPPLGVVATPGGAPVLPVRRQIPLMEDRSWSFDVGPGGTVVRDAATGLTVQVPAGAVASATHITVIALKGAPLAYRFEPHGLQFAAPVRLVQSLHGLKLTPELLGIPPLFGGYFANDSLPTDPVNGETRVLEVLPIRIDVKARTALLDVRHFSGYLVASAARDTLSER